jgi:hypothetical protein
MIDPNVDKFFAPSPIFNLRLSDVPPGQGRLFIAGTADEEHYWNYYGQRRLFLMESGEIVSSWNEKERFAEAYLALARDLGMLLYHAAAHSEERELQGVA